MFSFPVTVPFRNDEGVFAVDVTVNIDDIAVVNPLDKLVNSDVECNELYDYRPLSELILIDGRKLPVCEPPAIIHRYLDAYRQIEDFYTEPSIPILQPLSPNGPTPGESGVVIPLFSKARQCASSEGSTPA